jgi:hypothetical protein
VRKLLDVEFGALLVGDRVSIRHGAKSRLNELVDTNSCWRQEDALTSNETPEVVRVAAMKRKCSRRGNGSTLSERSRRREAYSRELRGAGNRILLTGHVIGTCVGCRRRDVFDFDSRVNGFAIDAAARE